MILADLRSLTKNEESAVTYQDMVNLRAENKVIGYSLSYVAGGIKVIERIVTKEYGGLFNHVQHCKENAELMQTLIEDSYVQVVHTSELPFRQSDQFYI